MSKKLGARLYVILLYSCCNANSEITTVVSPSRIFNSPQPLDSCTPSMRTQPLTSQGLASLATLRHWHGNSEVKYRLSSTISRSSQKWPPCPRPVGICLASCTAPALKHQVCVRGSLSHGATALLLGFHTVQQ